MRTLSLCLVTATCLIAIAACSGTDGDSPPDTTTGETTTGETSETTTGETTDLTTSTSGPATTTGTDTPVKEYPPAVTDVLDLPVPPFRYADIEWPPHFTQELLDARDNTPEDNPITDHGATLGRVLFHDKALSANDTTACASCHRQASGFSDPAKLSIGFEGGETGRNSMSLIETRFYRNGRFFWDERAPTLEAQVLMPIQDAVEMGLTLDELVQKVQERAYYPPLFEDAFGDPAVTSDRIARALAQFVRSIVSYRSRFDEGLAAARTVGEPFANFTPEENEGKDLFFGPALCAPCHLDAGPPFPPPPPNQAIFFIDVPMNNGLDAELSGADNGVGDQTGNPEDNGLFKSPSLRSVALTAPYMHDGRFVSLEEVVEFYDSGVKPHPNLHPRLAIPGTTPPVPRKLELTPAERAALVAFLETLTDEPLVADKKYSDPFKPALPP
jgi:cytochrome c peroxidase